MRYAAPTTIRRQQVQYSKLEERFGIISDFFGHIYDLTVDIIFQILGQFGYTLKDFILSNIPLCGVCICGAILGIVVSVGIGLGVGLGVGLTCDKSTQINSTMNATINGTIDATTNTTTNTTTNATTTSIPFYVTTDLGTAITDGELDSDAASTLATSLASGLNTNAAGVGVVSANAVTTPTGRRRREVFRERNRRVAITGFGIQLIYITFRVITSICSTCINIPTTFTMPAFTITIRGRAINVPAYLASISTTIPAALLATTTTSSSTSTTSSTTTTRSTTITGLFPG